MVFGSPKQRSTTGGAYAGAKLPRIMSKDCAPLRLQAEARGVTVLVEALPAAQSDVVLTLGEAAAIVREIGSPAVQTMFDTHNAVDETEPHAASGGEILRRHPARARQRNGRPLSRNRRLRFPAPCCTRLQELDYTGWVSLEVFDFSSQRG